VLRKAFSLLLIYCFCLHAGASAQTSTAQVTKEAKRAERIKKLIFQSGIGPGNDIEVKLRDKTRIAGYVSEVTDDHFVVTDAKTGSTTKLEYGQVDKAHLWRLTKNDFEARNSPSAVRIFRNAAIGFGIGVAVIGFICFASKRCAE
jgi:hypothetical protein